MSDTTDPTANTAQQDDGARPALLSPERIEGYMRSQDWSYRIEEDGSFEVWFNSTQVRLVPQGPAGDLLSILTYSPRQYLESDLPTIRKRIAEWHRDALWPTISVLPDDGAPGAVYLKTSHISDWRYGVTDVQLSGVINTIIGDSLEAMKYVEEDVQPVQGPETRDAAMEGGSLSD